MLLGGCAQFLEHHSDAPPPPGPVTVLAGALAGIPMPLPQVAAVPLIRGLRELGLGDGGVMALLSSIFQRPVLALYVATGFGTALLAGFVLLLLG